MPRCLDDVSSWSSAETPAHRCHRTVDDLVVQGNGSRKLWRFGVRTACCGVGSERVLLGCCSGT